MIFSGCLMVMICSIIVYCTELAVAKYVDPGISIVAAAVMLYLKYPISELTILDRFYKLQMKT